MAQLPGGTPGLDLLPYLEGVDRLLILDAIDAGAAPGTLIKLVGDEVPARLAIKMSPHQIGLSDLLAAARFQGSAPSEIVLIGMQPEQLEVKGELSKTVAEQLPALVEAALAQLTGWEITFTRKSPG